MHNADRNVAHSFFGPFVSSEDSLDVLLVDYPVDFQVELLIDFPPFFFFAIPFPFSVQLLSSIRFPLQRETA